MLPHGASISLNLALVDALRLSTLHLLVDALCLSTLLCCLDLIVVGWISAAHPPRQPRQLSRVDKRSASTKTPTHAHPPKTKKCDVHHRLCHNNAHNERVKNPM